MARRYRPRRACGAWTVEDSFTGWTVEFYGKPAVELGAGEANELAEDLNLFDARRLSRRPSSGLPNVQNAAPTPRMQG